MTIAVPQPNTATTRKTKKIEYPVRDGKPMAETDKHRDLMFYFVGALMTHFADRRDVYVSGNNFVFYEEGDPAKRISPDCYVVFGIPQRQRDSFMSWREGNLLPNVVFEFTSKKTRSEDTNTKRPLYETVLRVDEYFMFDPTGDYLRPRFQGLRLVEGRYEDIPLIEGRMHSEQLGLDLIQEGNTLRLFDPARGEFLLSLQEATQRAEAEAQKAKMQAQRAEAEAQARSEAEAQREEAEAQREEAEAENARLRTQLAALLGTKQI